MHSFQLNPEFRGGGIHRCREASPMRVAQIAPLYESVPPRYYGGTERVVAHLSNALVQRGHDVVLFASGDSETLADLVPCRAKALRLDENKLSWDLPAHLSMLAKVRERADEFDILHFHLDCYHMPLFANIADRTVTTLHGRQDIRDLWDLYRTYPRFPLVSISESQRAPVPHLRWVGTIHHGYPLSQYAFSPEPKGDYLAFLGRIAPEKGVDRAIAIATLARMPLRIAAKIDFADRGYFHDQIAPLIGKPYAEYIGEIGEDAKAAFLGNALALVFPIDWPEPFGLVMIEAMACGTPVIAFNRGSVPEIIQDGVTGFVVDSVEEAAEAAKLAVTLDRTRIRAIFEQRFSAHVMAQAYEAAYRRVLTDQARQLAVKPLYTGDGAQRGDASPAGALESTSISGAAA
jgi:glycosyltransferase involved in cell wall biosynthesis